MLCSAVFSTKKGLLSTHQSAIREAPTVFSRLPSLMAADKPFPQLQPSLIAMHSNDSLSLKTVAFIAGKKNPAIQKHFICFSIEIKHRALIE